MSQIALDSKIQFIKGVGPIMATRLLKLGIETVEDLLYHFPSRHEDSSQVAKIYQLEPGEVQTVVGQVVSARNVYTKRGRRMQKIVMADGTGQLEVTFFNQTYLVNQFNKAEMVSFSGKVDKYGGRWSMMAPSWEIIKGKEQKAEGEGTNTIHTGRLVPVYPETRGVSSKWLRSKIAELLPQTEGLIEDYMPEDLFASENLEPLAESIRQLHFPENNGQLDKARKRLAFDEMFLLQLASQRRKYLWQNKKLSHPLHVDQDKVTGFIADLPFILTGAQNKSIKEILTDLSQTKAMNRLLQGDVGAGKTVVAAVAMYVAYLNGLQSALMAPTEILAMQHYKTLKATLEPLGLNIHLTTGSSGKTQNVTHQPADKNNNFDIVVGTHALLYREIPEKLALLVVDEQHRFGVEQRAKLLKAKKTPHLLSMSATPIPRTVALTVYGELDISIIDEMPKGRKTIKTWVIPKSKRPAAYEWIEKQIRKEKVQAFVVCPLIEESEADGMTKVKSAEQEYAFLKKEIYPKLKLGLLHGRMKGKEKNKIIDDFAHKRIDLLVSTPVIEVGIDIANATIMMIEGAERFGLAQLHQLRGRVGRGQQQSYCLLFTSDKGFENMKRLKAMETMNSGFKLAELDLELRGPGEMYGVAQHGFSRLKVASFSDSRLIDTTNRLARNLIDIDPMLDKLPKLNEKLTSILEKQVEPN